MSNIKHIGLVGNTAWSMYNFRGKLMQSLVDSGYKVTVFAPYDGVFTPQIESLGCACVSVKINAKGINPLQDLLLINEFRFFFKRHNLDFIFCYTIKPNIYGSIAARICRIPHIAITTGLGYTFVSSGWVSRVAKGLYKFAFKSAAQVWFLNNDDKDAFVFNELIDNNKAFVLKSEGIDLSRFQFSPIVKTENTTFLLVARMLWDKGVGEFVKAARVIKKKYPETKFQLLGFLGVDNPSAINKEQMDKWQEEGIVEYLGATSDVLPYIKASTSVVLPSYREGIPLTLLEASACGRPIITTNSIGCKDTIDDGVTGFLCEVKDAAGLADCMEKMILLSRGDYDKMGKAARRKMENEFDVNIIINHYLQTLNRYL